MLYTQPQAGPLQIDWSNPISRGLLWATLPHLRRELVTGAAFTQEGTFSTAAGTAGLGLVTDGSASDIYLPIPSTTLTAFTVFGIFKSNSNAVDTRTIALGSSTDNNPIAQIGSSLTNAAKVRLWARGTGNIIPGSVVDSTASGFDGTIHQVAITCDGININCYIDGKLDSTNTLQSTSTFVVDRLCIGALRRGSTSSRWAGTTFFGAVWNRTLSASEVSSVSSFPANAWQLILDEDEEDEVFFLRSAGNTTISADGSSVGTSTIDATARAIWTSSGSGTGITSLSGVGNSINQTSGSSTGLASVSGTATLTFSVDGSSTGVGTAAGTAVSITQVSGSSNGLGSAAASSVSITTSDGNSTGTATLSGVGNAIWRVDGSSTGIATVAGASGSSATASADGSSNGTSSVDATGRNIFTSSGASSGTSSVGGVGQSFAQVISSAIGSSTVSGTGVLIAASTASSVGVSNVTGTANIIGAASGLITGTSSAQSVVVVVFQAAGFSVGASTIDAVTNAIKSVTANSTGTCTISGVSSGGVHYTAVGDRFNVTVLFAPYVIDFQGSPYEINRN